MAKIGEILRSFLRFLLRLMGEVVETCKKILRGGAEDDF